ncbi:unnamed protein product [Closterium sp. NIES-65]|nr:unnamed protein product [Closterium sp. NIES-65]
MTFNVSHVINSLSFGAKFPGLVNPLDGVKWIQEKDPGMYQYFIKEKDPGMYQYFIKVRQESPLKAMSLHTQVEKGKWIQEVLVLMYQYFIKVRLPVSSTQIPACTALSNDGALPADRNGSQQPARRIRLLPSLPCCSTHAFGPQCNLLVPPPFFLSLPQFSVTEHFRPSEMGHSLPGVFFFYDLSPIKVRFTEQNTSFLHFLTNVCAIIGGVFTVTGIIDAVVYHGHKAIKKKMELGKLS